MKSWIAAGALALALSPAGSATAQRAPVSLADSFEIGGNGLCTAQVQPPRPGDGLYDRSYTVVCRDAAAPVGLLYVIKDAADATTRMGAGSCTPAEAVAIDGVGQAQVLRCAAGGSDPAAIAYLVTRGRTTYAARGVAGYESALRLGLATIALDRRVDGPVEIAVTGNSDAASFARTQAQQLSGATALGEAYRRSNAGDFAAAAEFFSVANVGGTGGSDAEALLNAGLQQSNLGNAAAAADLFAAARPKLAGDAVLGRMARNFEAIDRLNAGDARGALTRLAQSVPVMAAAADSAPGADLAITPALADRLNAEAAGTAGIESADAALTPAERADVLDAQAAQLRGTAYRLTGDGAQARTALAEARTKLASVRGGRLGSVVWMSAQIEVEFGRIAEAEGNLAEAERSFRTAAALVEARYPSSPALLSSRAQLAGFLARHGRAEEAVPLYRSVVELAQQAPSPSLKRSLTPYFALLAGQAEKPEAVADMFAASQVMVRPGVAQTQAVLARELSAGDDTAAQLFRRSVSLTREIERTRIAAAALAAEPQPTAPQRLQLAGLQERLGTLQATQTQTQSELGAFARYRVVSGNTLTLDGLRETLRPGEAYWKLVVLDDDSYALFVTPEGARSYRTGLSAAALDEAVTALRHSITFVEADKRVTQPFDVARARMLYQRLFGPVAEQMSGVRHLIVEPDGALLSLPVNLLVASDAGLDAYRARAAAKSGDPYDFTGVAWLGRTTDVSTAVSAGAFRDIRQARPSAGARTYLGLGENAPVNAFAQLTGATPGGTRSVSQCDWALSAWSHPISAAELVTARDTIARAGGAAGGEVLTGAAFSDTNILGKPDLGQFRIIHFATHGLVTAPRPDCPARPALLTSFGGEGSDGLLTFGEIFDLKLDADLVILSACDTAGGATVATTRAAGLTTGGGTALDGLVRAFVGAGGRTVLASHWPVPDDYQATERLVTGLFQAPPGTSSADALRTAQRGLMDDPRTSHPYYWAAFAIVGDGSVPVIRPATTAAR